MASSSRRGGAGGKKSVTSPSTQKARPAAKKGRTAKAVAKGRAKSETGVIAVKRAGVLPRQARSRAPLPLAPDASVPEVAPEALTPIVPDGTDEITAELVLPEHQACDEPQPYVELEVVAQIETAVATAQPLTGALPETPVADDVTEEMPVAELVALTIDELPTPPPVPAPVAGPTGMSWLMAKLRRLAGARA
jgi:hypothetical protein